MRRNVPATEPRQPKVRSLFDAYLAELELKFT